MRCVASGQGLIFLFDLLYPKYNLPELVNDIIFLVPKYIKIFYRKPEINRYMNLNMMTLTLNLFNSELVSMLLNSAKEAILSYTFNSHTKPYWNSDAKIAHKSSET